MVKYTVQSHHPASHIFNITLEFQPLGAAQQLILPCWIPGSYTIRDFARHITALKLSNESGNHYSVKKLNSYTWEVGCVHPVSDSDFKLGLVSIEYEVYAWDRSVRGAHLDTTHAFINLSCLSLMVVGQEMDEHQVQVCMPKLKEPSDWRVATTLTPYGIERSGFGWYSAKNYAELIDHPIEMGHLERISFLVNDIPHEIVISGQHQGDVERLKSDVQKIAETHHLLFDNHPTLRSPFEKYCFLLTLVGEGYGGLEHRSSTALISPRANMPKRAPNFSLSKEYKELLGLFSHEYFHAWNIKCIKPAVFCPYDLTQPQYTYQLWAFEGITSYYDELALVRSNVITPEEYFLMMSDQITQLQSTPGQFKQTLAESSFDAWIKFYKPNENTKNSSVSYYKKGMLAALCFDMMLRTADSPSSLDEVMRALWANYKEGQGVVEGEIERLLCEKAQNSEAMKQLIHCAIYTTQALPLEQALASVGLQLDYNLMDETATLALGIIVEPLFQELIILTVLDKSAAMIAGLSAKDSLVAINDLRVTNTAALEKILMHYQVGETVLVQAFREDRLMSFQVELLPAPQNKANISISQEASQQVEHRRHQWLNP